MYGLKKLVLIFSPVFSSQSFDPVYIAEHSDSYIPSWPGRLSITYISVIINYHPETGSIRGTKQHNIKTQNQKQTNKKTTLASSLWVPFMPEWLKT